VDGDVPVINTGSLARFQPLGARLLRPIYDDYSFGNIPDTIEYLLTGARRGPLLPPDCFGGTYPRPDKVVLIFIDSFGWQFWQDYHARFRATSRVVQKGTLTPISALFLPPPRSRSPWSAQSRSCEPAPRISRAPTLKRARLSARRSRRGILIGERHDLK
jgi:hypothetical protein